MLLRPSLLLLALLAAATLRAQPVVDGVTVGIGVSTYQGDLDLNPNDGPVEFLALGSPFVHVAADRTFGPVITEASLQLDRYAIESELIDMHLTAASLNLTGGLRFEVTEQVPIQVFAGVAPMLVMPTYDRIDDSVIAGNAYDFEEQGGHVVWTFPVGVVIQDVVRFGFRFVAGDDFDSTAGHTDAPDFITFVSLGYRFDLLR